MYLVFSRDPLVSDTEKWSELVGTINFKFPHTIVSVMSLPDEDAFPAHSASTFYWQFDLVSVAEFVL